MHIAYTAEQERLRRELREYFATLMTPQMRVALADTGGEYGSGDAYRAVVRQLGADGWLALGWPQEIGGRGGTMLHQLIFTDEAAVPGVPLPVPSLNTRSPTVTRVGTPGQKPFFPPPHAPAQIPLPI